MAAHPPRLGAPSPLRCLIVETFRTWKDLLCYDGRLFDYLRCSLDREEAGVDWRCVNTPMKIFTVANIIFQDIARLGWRIHPTSLVGLILPGFKSRFIVRVTTWTLKAENGTSVSQFKTKCPQFTNTQSTSQSPPILFFKSMTGRYLFTQRTFPFPRHLEAIWTPIPISSTMFKIFSYIHWVLLLSLLRRILTLIPSLVLLLANEAICSPYLAVTTLVLLLRLTIAVGQWVRSPVAPCTCRVEMNEREEEQATLVATPVPKDKNKGKGGYWDLFGRRPGSPFGSFGGVFGAIHVWNMRTDDGGADRNPFLETPGTDGPVTSTPAEFGPRRLPTGRETELPEAVAGPLARARALARRAFDLWPKKKDDGFEAPAGLLAASPSASPNEGTPTSPLASSSAVTLDAAPPAPPTSEPSSEPSIPIIRIDPPPEESPPPARPRPRATSRIGQANRVTSLISTSDCRAVALCKPNTRLTIPLPHISTSTSPDASNHTPAHEVLSKIANGLEPQPLLFSEEEKRTLMIYVAVKEDWKERFDRIFPKGGLKEWLKYISTQELLERGNVIEEHINTYGKEGKKNMGVETHNAIVADLEGKGLLKPRLVRVYETFTKENPNANEEAWITHYKKTTTEEKNKLGAENRFKAELEKKAFRAKIVAGKRISQGAFSSAEARMERKNEKAPAPKPKTAPIPVPGTAAARKVSGMRVPAARPVSQERLGQDQEKSIVPTRRPRPLPYNKATPGASSSKPPPTPTPATPPKRRLTTEFIASALAKATITTSASPPDKRKELAENKHAHEVLSPYKHVLFPEWEEEAKKGGCKNFLRWLHYRLENMRVQTLVDDLEPWATANPEGTVDDLVAYVKEQGGVEKVKRKFRPVVEHYYFEFKDVHPGGTGREWGEYLEEKMKEAKAEEEEEAGEEKRHEPPIVGVCKLRVQSPPKVNTRGTVSGIKPPTTTTTKAPAVAPPRRPVKASSPPTARPSPLPRPTKTIAPPKPTPASKTSTSSKLPAPAFSRFKTNKATKENVQPVVPPKPATAPKASTISKLPAPAFSRLRASKATKENIRPSGLSSAAPVSSAATNKTVGQVITGVKKVLGEKKANIPPPRPVIRLCRNHTEYDVQEMDFTRDPGPAPRGPTADGARQSFGYRPPPIPTGRGGWR